MASNKAICRIEAYLDICRFISIHCHILSSWIW